MRNYDDTILSTTYFPIAPDFFASGFSQWYSKTMRTRTNELEELKRIDLLQYAATRGFALDQKKSSKNNPVMRHPCGDKLIIKRNPQGHYIYFNAKGNDSGTIIDFIQARESLSIGEIRKHLRPWMSGSISTNQAIPKFGNEIPLKPQDLTAMRKNWEKAQPIIKTHPYLEYERHIPRHVLTDPIFQGRIRIDQRKNALFPHFKENKLSGFEVKNRSWTGFSPGGSKGLAYSRRRPGDCELILCETAVDMLSYAALYGTNHKVFVSTAGYMSPAQLQELRRVVNTLPEHSKIILAFDRDPGGWKLATKVKTALEDCSHEIIEHYPERLGDDWNDELRRSVLPQLRPTFSMV